MSTQFNSNNPTSYFGVLPTMPGQNWFRRRDPNSTDYKNYAIGDRWINEVDNSAWTLVSKAFKTATWIQATNVFASSAETIAGVITDKSVSPATLSDKLGPQTLHGVMLGEGPGAALNATAAGAAGFPLLSGGPGADPIFNVLSLTSAVAGVLPVTNGGTGVDRIASFGTYVSAPVANVTGNSGLYVIIFDTEIFDVGGNYNNATGIFTAPVAGKYQINARLSLSNSTSTTLAVISILTTTQRYDNIVRRTASTDDVFLQIAQVVLMNAGDQCFITVAASGEAGDTLTLGGDAFSNTSFSGCWVG